MGTAPGRCGDSVEPGVTPTDGVDLPPERGARKGKVTLVANVASECGFTPQYAGTVRAHPAPCHAFVA